MTDPLEELLKGGDDEIRAVRDIIYLFKASLMAPENQNHLYEFHFGCTASEFAGTIAGWLRRMLEILL
ncbi:hypothetical protein RRU01S_13_00090 [Agrobacterium rubi TR3 = NBRC 13261]|uniref:Uncharacterized protein n=1 Tax=Agrobacterium rubi TR3 = NBRC 13261 TaxID=1368415 RepID=A0A081CVH5_9HYPH|nr:hypothetical protein [Agrobacterium rubi]MBP1877636.1 hypothetical protein [Agrobacterium rubi]GAK70671.1 hypothetical protein RRU01S_13_00090 [Agrobacterium rubi TR3 = NBRC 13261]